MLPPIKNEKEESDGFAAVTFIFAQKAMLFIIDIVHRFWRGYII